MARMSYTEQLKHPNWQRLRLEKLSAAQWMCEDCFSAEDTLHVHHKHYIKGRMAWEYAEDELRVLCEDCHSGAHWVDDETKKILVKHPPNSVLCVLAGYFESNGKMDMPFYWGDRAFHAGMLGKVFAELSEKSQNAVIKYLLKLRKSDAKGK